MTSRTAQHAVPCVTTVLDPSVLVAPAVAVRGAVPAELLVGALTRHTASTQTPAYPVATEARTR
ncbi:hypothetical protein [Micromonospora sp. WMMD737]|uniref:hypothetical protein n=1 Tax=Micromonospora sp. WMMD737 TaxID=3404113 RepID=UPI003B92BCE8